MEATTDLENKYEKGKIYKLCCKDANITEIYIGSTVNHYRRKCHHKHSCNNPNSKNYNFYVYQFIRENGGFDNWDLVILEEYSAKNKNELTWKEREWVEQLKPVLNSRKPIVTLEECREYKKKWCEDNSEQKRQTNKIYRENNPEKFREYQKIYRENNPEKLRERDRKYYEENREKLSEKRKERVKCDICDKDLSRASLTVHKKRIHNA